MQVRNKFQGEIRRDENIIIQANIELDLDAIFEYRNEKHEPDSAPNSQVLNTKSAQRFRYPVVHHLR